MKKEIIQKSCIGFIVGIAVVSLLNCLLSAIFGQTAFFFIVNISNQHLSTLINGSLYGLLGALFGCSSLLWELKNWSELKQTLVHFTLLSCVIVPTVWMKYLSVYSMFSIACSILIYLGIFFALYQIQRLKSQYEITKINAALHNTTVVNHVKGGLSMNGLNERLKLLCICMVPFLVVYLLSVTVLSQFYLPAWTADNHYLYLWMLVAVLALLHRRFLALWLSYGNVVLLAICFLVDECVDAYKESLITPDMTGEELWRMSSRVGAYYWIIGVILLLVAGVIIGRVMARKRKRI